MILAAGLGRRMREVNAALPKPMIVVGGRTLIDRALDLAERAGVQEAVVNTAYMAEIIEAHLAARPQPRIAISREEEPLETGGGICRALHLLGKQPFAVINSDVIVLDGVQNPLVRMQAHFDAAAMDALLLVHPTDRAMGYAGEGDFFLEAEGRLRRRLPGERAPYIFAGIQMLHPRLFDQSPAGAFSMNRLWDRGRDAAGRLDARIRGLTHDGAWMHVGDALGLKEAEAYLASR